VILALTAALAIVVHDHTPLRAEPRSSAPELTALWQGDVLEVRGGHAGYLKVYNYRRERGGYVKGETVREVEFTEANAPELLAVLRFLRDSPGSEALGISYGAAYLKAAPARALTGEAYEAIARMAERLADEATGDAYHVVNVAIHIDVVEQFGIHMRTFERNGQMKLCYDGDLYRRVMGLAGASAEERASAALGLTRPDCIDPDLGPAARASLDDERRTLLDQVNERELSVMTRSRLHARRAAVWASVAFEQIRQHLSPGAAAERALTEVLAVNASELGDDLRVEYEDALIRVGAIRWAAKKETVPSGTLMLTALPGEAGQTCVALEEAPPRRAVPLVRRCTYGIVWMASTLVIPQGPALALAVQPIEGWRELWLFHQRAGTWVIDVLSPAAVDPEQGYVEFAGFAPGPRRVLIAREWQDRGRVHRRFEEVRLDDLALVRQASTPDLLRDFGQWQDAAWRRDTLALH
jgi:hypothetical protein